MEYDLIEIYKVNKSYIHDPFRAREEELDSRQHLSSSSQNLWTCMESNGKTTGKNII